MFKFLLIATLVPALVLGAMDMHACPSGGPMPASLTINDCSGRTCHIPVGGAVNAVAHNIVSPSNSGSARAHIRAYLAGLDLGFENPTWLDDVCTYVGCPLVAGQQYSFPLSIPQLNVPARGVEIEVEVGLTGDGGANLGCVRFYLNIH